MQGDFEAFYLRHFKTIYRVCYAFMKNAQDAEDCTEDTFVKAMTSDVSFENERHERSWLTTTAMNICKDKLKHWWRQKVEPIDEDTEQIAVEPDEKSEVVEAVMALPVKYKEVVRRSSGCTITRATRPMRSRQCSAGRRRRCETNCATPAQN